MSVLVSSGCLGFNRSVKEVVSIYIEGGIPGIELSSSHFHEPGILDFLKKAEADFRVHNYFPPPKEPFILNLASSDDLIRRRSIDVAKNAIDVCRELGCPIYSLHTGFLVDLDLDLGRGDLKALSHDEGMELFFGSLEALCDYARSAGIDIAVENNPCMPDLVGSLLFDDVGDFEIMFREPAFSDVSVLLDLGHLKVSSSVLGFDAYDFISCVADRTTSVHVHDNDGVVDKHDPFTEDSWCIRAIRRFGLADRNLIVEIKSRDIAGVLECRELLGALGEE